jgi:hypothetical protein
VDNKNHAWWSYLKSMTLKVLKTSRLSCGAVVRREKKQLQSTEQSFIKVKVESRIFTL